MMDKLNPLNGFFSKTIQQYFKINQDAFAPLAKHVGKVIAFKISSPNTQLYLQIKSDGIEFISSTHADVCVMGNALAFLKMIGSQEIGPHTLMQHQIKIIGDTHLIEDFMRAAKTLPDIEQWIANVAGDMFAVQLTSSMKSTHRFFKDFIESRAQDVADYVSIENEKILGKSQLDDFSDAVYDLETQVQKLTARVHKLRLSRHEQD